MQNHWKSIAVAAAAAAVGTRAAHDPPSANSSGASRAVRIRPTSASEQGAIPFDSPVRERSARYRPICCTARCGPTSATLDGSNGGAKRKGAATRSLLGQPDRNRKRFSAADSRKPSRRPSPHGGGEKGFPEFSGPAWIGSFLGPLSRAIRSRTRAHGGRRP